MKNTRDDTSGALARFCPWLRSGLVLLLAGLLCLALFPGLAPAQERQKIPLQEDESAELINRIREGMREIDDNLLNAGAAGVKEQLAENARNIEKLLQESRDRSSQVIQDLNELIKKAKYKPSGQ